MLKLAQNALASLGSLYHQNSGEIQWNFFHHLHNLQQEEGLNLRNKFSAQHLQYEKRKMNVWLDPQTLGSSVANAIKFLDVSMKRTELKNSEPTVKLTKVIDRAFDIFNSRSPQAKGNEQPLRPVSKHIWEDQLKSTTEYLLSLGVKQKERKGKNKRKVIFATHRRKTFIVGFVATIKFTINMAHEMFSLKENPFEYLLIYKFYKTTFNYMLLMQTI